MTQVPTMEWIFHGRYKSHGMDVPKFWAMEWSFPGPGPWNGYSQVLGHGMDIHKSWAMKCIFPSLEPWNGYSIVPKKNSLLLTTITSTTTLTPNYYH